ncbi:putative AfsR-like transcriptional regulator [Streptantibioticus cattleyicolor NRRL 8057 = DSM 46488]|uniref:Putative AfsR-like transcriptional regulator n=2 Tax=Kitasatosporales TaxID=85011 RepID=F8K1M2_STREN|nr:putative AfsR-like transcriptional regulator [Streptantibioticus cattleyicolor NRRL 8057 = DSM 46488]CCB75406.1 putative AfsR-like transcriptional regulator [Streptantibioticus cattleyicolor NRRL 8057 = DSM 46488]
MLILAWGRVVSVGALVDAVWGDRPPTTARTQVAICIGALRKAFKQAGVEDDIISTAHPGYRLETARSETDALEFTSMVSDAAAAVRGSRLDDASALYTRALALWKGPALAGVTGQPVEDEATRLEERRLSAYKAWSDVDLALGRHQELIPELTAVAQNYPLDEQLRHNLMLAQYRAGRRGEATEGFRSWRRYFVDELGLEPSPVIQELHNAILRDEPGLALPAESAPPPETRFVPAELPPDAAAFQGREAELAQLDTLLDRPPAGQPTALGFVTGVAGVGKTALVVHWAHRAAGQFPDGQLYADFSGGDGDQPPMSAHALIERFLRALGVPGEQIPADPGARESLYRSVLAERRVLVVLDNVSGVEEVLPLVPGSGRCCVLVTSREQLDHLAVGGAVRVGLGLMSEAEAERLIARIAGEERVAADPSAVRELFRLCDGLPLALRIAAARLAVKRHWSVAHLVHRLSDERRRLDELSTGGIGVRASFAVSYRGLPKKAGRMYRRLGLLNVPDFTAWAGAALLDVSPGEAEDLIERLVDANLLTVTGTDATGTLRYGLHDLLRLYARELAQSEESEEERDEARGRVLRTLLTLAEEGHRREYGGDFSVIHGSTPRRPLDPALVDGLLRSPLKWFDAERSALVALLVQACDLGLDELAWDLAMSSVVLFETRADYDNWRLVAQRALEAAQKSGNRRGEAAMWYELGSVEMFQQRFDRAVPLFEVALGLFEEVGEVHGHALTLRNLAIVHRVRGDLVSAMGKLSAARDVLHEVGDASAEAHALGQMAQIELDWGNADEAVTLSREAVRIATGLGETRGAAQALNRLAGAYLRQGRYDAAEESYQWVLRLVREKGDSRGEAYALLGLGETHVVAERYPAAEQVLLEALRLTHRVNDLFLLARVNLTLGRCNVRLGRPDRAGQFLTLARSLFRQMDSPAGEQQAAREMAALGGGAPRDLLKVC